MLKEARQVIAQEDEYAFPYHYVTKFGSTGFRQHFVDTWGINYALSLEFVIDRVRRAQPASLVDVGCGDGRLTHELGKIRPTLRLCGVDSSTKAIALARALNPDRSEMAFYPLDITRPHDLGEFDAAVLMEVFEHVPPGDCDGFMSAVRRLVRLGGKLFLTVPHANKPLEYKHFQHFTTDTLLKYLQPHFTVETVLPFEKAAYRRKLLDKVLCNSLFVLNSPRLLNAIYGYHKRRLFRCDTEARCQRLYVEATAV